MSSTPPITNNETRERERLLRILAAITFLIFFQGYMVAPMIPHLAMSFGISEQKVGLLVPAYLIPYGISTLFFGALVRLDWPQAHYGRFAAGLCWVDGPHCYIGDRHADDPLAPAYRTGRKRSRATCAGSHRNFVSIQGTGPASWMVVWRNGWRHGVGSTLAVILEPVLGWRGVFLGVSACSFLSILLLGPYLASLGERPASRTLTLRGTISGYTQLLSSVRAQRTYGLVFLNAVFHSGVFTWLGLYFSRRFGLGEIGIGLALLGYGLPGFALGPLIGRAADRWGRHWLVPAGISGRRSFSFFAGACMADRVRYRGGDNLSLGYDMTQPPLAGIVTALDPKRSGQAMGLNVFVLFTGFGLGSLLFGSALHLGFTQGLAIFAGVQALAGLAAAGIAR